MTMWRTRRRTSSSSPSRARASSRPSWGDVAQGVDAEEGGALLAAGAAFAVLALAVGVLDAGVDDEEAEAFGGEVERDLPLGEVAGVEEQGVPGPAAGGGGLVHDADGGADVDVLGALAEAGELPALQAEVVQVVQGERDDDLQRGRGGQAGAGGDGGGEVDVGSGDGVAGLAQCPHDARRVGGPCPVGVGGEVVEAEFGDAGVDVRGVQAQDAAVAAGDGRDGGVRQRERHDEAVVVVGVLADEVDAAGCRPHPVGVSSVQGGEVVPYLLCRHYCSLAIF
ncbi:hypothetical protein GCM10020256_45580 [Streptomyces thermocoprophilus]